MTAATWSYPMNIIGRPGFFGTLRALWGSFSSKRRDAAKVGIGFVASLLLWLDDSTVVLIADNFAISGLTVVIIIGFTRIFHQAMVNRYMHAPEARKVGWLKCAWRFVTNPRELLFGKLWQLFVAGSLTVSAATDAILVADDAVLNFVDNGAEIPATMSVLLFGSLLFGKLSKYRWEV